MVAIKPENTVPEFVTDGKYILDENGDPVPMPHLIAWGEWMQHHRADRVVGKTQVESVSVSTVFLGLDHGIGDKLELFETMCFAGKAGEEFEGGDFFGRYATRAEAVEGHARIVELVTAELGQHGPKEH